MNERAEKLARCVESVCINVNFRFPDIEKAVDDALKYNFRVLIGPLCLTEYMAARTKGSGTSLCSPIGTPTGVEEYTGMKVLGAKKFVELGGEDVDMVINLMYLRSGMYEKALSDIRAVREAVPKNTLKVVIEAPLLTPEELKAACEIVCDSGADYVKTSTGATGATTLEIVQNVKAIVGDRVLIKAAGGINSIASMEAILAAGAARIGLNNVKAGKFFEELTK